MFARRYHEPKHCMCGITSIHRKKPVASCGGLGMTWMTKWTYQLDNLRVNGTQGYELRAKWTCHLGHS